MEDDIEETEFCLNLSQKSKGMLLYTKDTNTIWFVPKLGADILRMPTYTKFV